MFAPKIIWNGILECIHTVLQGFKESTSGVDDVGGDDISDGEDDVSDRDEDVGDGNDDYGDVGDDISDGDDGDVTLYEKVESFFLMSAEHPYLCIAIWRRAAAPPSIL